MHAFQNEQKIMHVNELKNYVSKMSLNAQSKQI